MSGERGARSLAPAPPARTSLPTRLVERWKDPEADGTVPTVLAFLREHAPDQRDVPAS